LNGTKSGKSTHKNNGRLVSHNIGVVLHNNPTGWELPRNFGPDPIEYKPVAGASIT